MKQTTQKNITIADIAQAAGVSKTTVSRYLNGKYDLMSQETRARIETVIRMANYRPSSIAQSLRGSRTMQIGIVVSDISSPFCSSMIRSLGHSLLDAGYVPLFADSKDDPDVEKSLIQTLLSRKVDGLVVNTTSYINPYLIQVACDGVPIVLCDRYVKDFRFPIVSYRHREAVAEMMSHLKEEGFAKVALFTQDNKNISTRFIRKNAYLSNMKALYPQEDGESLIFQIDLPDLEKTKRHVQTLLSTCAPGEIPAIFAVNSMSCMHILTALRELNLSTPQDLGICTPDDWGWDTQFCVSPLNNSGITAFNVHPARMGSLIADILLERLQNPNAEKKAIFLPSELVIRQSTQLRAFQSSQP